MKNKYLPLRSEVLKKFPGDLKSMLRVKELRKEGYRLIHHPIWPTSVETPSGEFFDETRLKVRYGMVKNKETLEKAYEYLVLCEERVGKITGLEFSLD